MDCYPEYKHNHHHYQPPSSLYANVHHPYYANDPLRQSGYHNDPHHQYYPDGYRHHQHYMHHPATVGSGSYSYETNNEHNSQFYNGYSNAHQASYYEHHHHSYESYRNAATSNAYRYHQLQQQQHQQSAYNHHQMQNHPQNFYHHHQQHPVDHFNRYSTPQPLASPVYQHNPMRNFRSPSSPPPTTSNPSSQYESERHDNKLLNNEIKHMESIRTQQSSPSSSNPSTHNTLLAKINDSVDKNEAPIDDRGNDEVQQVKSETIPKALTPSSECSEGDNENRIKSESETQNSRDSETVNSNKSSCSDENEDKKCNLDSSREIEVENHEKSPQSANGSFKENNHLQNEASPLPRTNNFRQQEEAATGKKRNGDFAFQFSFLFCLPQERAFKNFIGSDEPQLNWRSL